MSNTKLLYRDRILFGQKWVFIRCSTCGTFHYKKRGIQKKSFYDPKAHLCKPQYSVNKKSKNQKNIFNSKYKYIDRGTLI